MNSLDSAEKQIFDVLYNNKELFSIYGNNMFLGSVTPNVLSSVPAYLFVQRISGTTLDSNYVDGTPGDQLRRVRIQVDIADVDYTNMTKRSLIVRSAVKGAFPSSIDSDTSGYVAVGQKIFEVCSLDLVLTEQG